MRRILLIDPDRASLIGLRETLAAGGYTDVVAAASGSFAVTMLERDRPDIIVCRAAVPDIDGYELCAIVRSDPALRGVRFLLLAGTDDDEPGRAFETGADRVLVGESGVHTVVAEIASLLAPAAGADGPPEPGADTTHALRGSLDVMDVADIAQAIGLGLKTGDLILALDGGQATVAFDRGRVVHAEWADLTGEEAFAALVADAERSGGGSFSFVPLEGRPPGLPRTMNRSVEQLLLSAAAAIDERRAGQAPAPTGPGACR
jgi:CheY-like chemotaxis protein